MPRPKSVAYYRLHKPSGQTRVIIAGRHHYLGPYGSPLSREQYARLVAGLFGAAAGAAAPDAGLGEGRYPPLSVNELLGRYRSSRSAITSVTAPPYSPDFNPIEMAFSKLKQLMRSAAHRTMTALGSDVQRMLDKITAGDAQGFIRHCGYVLQTEYKCSNRRHRHGNAGSVSRHRGKD